jgi:hypothetical protein
LEKASAMYDGDNTELLKAINEAARKRLEESLKGFLPRILGRD